MVKDTYKYIELMSIYLTHNTRQSKVLLFEIEI